MKLKKNPSVLFGTLGLLFISSLVVHTAIGTALAISFQTVQQSNPNSTPPPQTAPNTPKPNQELKPTPTQSPRQTNPVKPTPASLEAPSEINALYSQLQNSLQKNDWKVADELTYKLMLSLAGPDSKAEGRFNLTEWENFSCNDLKKIDTLWSGASKGKLGFNAQKRIFEAAGSSPSVFFSRIKWLFIAPSSTTWLVAWKYDQETKQVTYLPKRSPNFTTPAEGHLPAMLVWAPQANGKSVDLRFQKINQCSL